jgi:hypothetical protein
VHTLWRIYSDEADAAVVGQQWNRQFAHGLRATLQFRERLTDQRFLDVQFIDTVRQPMEVVEAIYAFLDMRLDARSNRRCSAGCSRTGGRPGSCVRGADEPAESVLDGSFRMPPVTCR